jgi:hypothetical protein
MAERENNYRNTKYGETAKYRDHISTSAPQEHSNCPEAMHKTLHKSERHSNRRHDNTYE